MILIDYVSSIILSISVVSINDSKIYTSSTTRELNIYHNW